MKKLFENALKAMMELPEFSARDVAKKMAELDGNGRSVFEFVDYAEMALAAKWGRAW